MYDEYENETMEEIKKRVKGFLWGMGGFTIVAACGYLSNINDIREIDPYKLATIVVVVASGYVVNQISKYLNK